MSAPRETRTPRLIKADLHRTRTMPCCDRCAHDYAEHRKTVPWKCDVEGCSCRGYERPAKRIGREPKDVA